MNVPIGQQNINFPGYGMFWVANSISSTVMGFANRHLQEKAAERNIEFQNEMEQVRTMTEDMKLREEIAFKRRLMKLSRQYRQIESASAFTTRMKGLELKAFLQKDWPLDSQLPYVLLNEIEALQTSCTSQPLNVILFHSPLLPVSKYGQPNNDDIALYKNLEYTILQEDVPCMGLGDVKFRKDACVKTDVTGGNANIMNIHFLMNQLPTLVISPRYHEGKLTFNGAVWEPQAARPMIRPLFSLDYEPKIAAEDKKYLNQAIDLYHASISTIIGAVRDSYMMLTQGKEPTLDKWLNDGKHDKIKAIVKSTPELLGFIKQENESILTALVAEKTPKLLEAYSEEDIQSMRTKIQSINI